MEYNDISILRLEEDEKVESFDCGDDDLNDFIVNEAQPYRKALIATSYIAQNKEGILLGFFSLANDKISLSNFASKTEYNRFRKTRFVNEKRLKGYPAVKLCRLGISTLAHGQHIGSYLLDFIKSYFVNDNKTGCRFLTVDAYANAVPFYIKNGFMPLNDDDKDDSTRLLYFDLATL